VPTPTDPPPTPALRGWLEAERAWGRHAIHATGTQRRHLLEQMHGLERFGRRMALVNLTGSVARWANGLHEGLSRNGLLDAAAAFDTPPPFPETDAGPVDCDHLQEYIQERVERIGEIHAAEEADV
jgi:hypothetical protein